MYINYLNIGKSTSYFARAYALTQRVASEQRVLSYSHLNCVRDPLWYTSLDITNGLTN